MESTHQALPNKRNPELDKILSKLNPETSLHSSCLALRLYDNWSYGFLTVDCDVDLSEPTEPRPVVVCEESTDGTDIKPTDKVQQLDEPVKEKVIGRLMDSCSKDWVLLNDICIKVITVRRRNIFLANTTTPEMVCDGYSHAGTYEKITENGDILSQWVMLMKVWIYPLTNLILIKADNSSCPLRMIDLSMDTVMRSVMPSECSLATYDVFHIVCITSKENITNNMCPYGTYQCRSGSCVPDHVICDGISDCPQSEDEDNCPAMCTENGDAMISTHCKKQCMYPDCICEPVYFPCLEGGCLHTAFICEWNCPMSWRL